MSQGKKKNFLRGTTKLQGCDP